MSNQIQNDLSQKYSKSTIVAHWLTALLVFILFPLGKYMARLAPSEKMGLIQIHVILGFLLLGLTLFRLYCLLKKAAPPALKTGSALNDKFIILTHYAFYFLLFGLSISGIATLFSGGYTLAFRTGSPTMIAPNDTIVPLGGHGILAMILLALLVVHITGVIKHYISTQENTLKRIS